MSERDEPFTLGTVRSLDDTALALRIELRDEEVVKYVGERMVVIPKSQIHDDSEVYETFQEGKLVITEWLAEQRGWL